MSDQAVLAKCMTAPISCIERFELHYEDKIKKQD